MVRPAVLLAAASDLPPGDGWLDPREEEVLAGLRVPKRRAEWLLGRWTAKRAVSLFLARESDAGDRGGAGGVGVGEPDREAPAPASVCILAASDGAPEAWIGTARAPCVVSISHRAGRACCAVAGPAVELGCDLELVEPRTDGFLADYLSNAEAEVVRERPDERDLRANLIWSAKESVLKARRTGLREAIRSVRVVSMNDVTPANLWSRLEVQDPSDNRWRVWWGVRDGFVLTVAARPPSREPVELYPDPTTPSTSLP